MTLTKDDRLVLAALVAKELAEVKKEKLPVVNSPYINKSDSSALAYLKGGVLYIEFLEKLQEKL